MKKSKGNLTEPTDSLIVKLKSGMPDFGADMAEAAGPVLHTASGVPAGSFEQSILMSSLSGIYVYDPTTGGNTFVNPQYTRLTGYTLEDLQALKSARLFALIHPEDQKRAAAHLRRLRRADDDDTMEVEYRFKKADGCWMWCLAKEAVFERDGQGSVRRIIGSFLDITPRRRIEDELEKNHRHFRELSRKSIEALEYNRQTIAKELHDSVAASLAAIKIKLEKIFEQIRQKPQDAAASLGETIPHLQAVIKETKQIAAELRPAMLDDLGLLSTISWYTRQFSAQFSNIQMKPQIEVREEDIPETHKIVIYRVLQESLNNAAKHSDAVQIDVCLKSDADRIVLEVADDGRGFDVQKTLNREDPLNGLGLANMIERAEIVGGSLTIDSAYGKGTRIKMILGASPYTAGLPIPEPVNPDFWR